MGGGERLVEAILEIYPQADIFTLLFNPPKISEAIKRHKVHTSFIQGIPLSRRYYRKLLPLFPLATEQFDLRGYDLVISSDSACIKGVLTRPETLHICYCHTPIRYAWDMYHDYFENERPNILIRPVMKAILHYIRMYDFQAAQRVDKFIANSQFVANRIANTYRRKAEVIYPPVDVKRFDGATTRQDFYLMVSRLVSYKRVDLVVEAFRNVKHRLVVVGEGPELNRLRKKAPPNVNLVGSVDDGMVVDYMKRCRGFILPGLEDFGIAPVEAQAAGKPVIAYGAGGALETVVHGFTGIHFEEQSTDSLREVIAQCEETDWDSEAIRVHAAAFSRARFQKELADFVDRSRKQP